MYIVDRIEGDFVVCELENKSTVDIRIDLFSFPVKAGDVVYLKDGKYYFDEDTTKERADRIKELMDDLWE